MKPTAVVLAAAWVVVACAPRPAGAQSVGDGNSPDSLAAASLLHSAVSLSQEPDAKARAARMVALAEYARQYAPQDPRIELMLSGIYEAQGLFDQAAKSLAVYVRQYPQDHLQQVHLLRLSLGDDHTAEARVARLSAAVEDPNLPQSVRAEAAVLAGQVLEGMGEANQAMQVYQRALTLDEYQPGALSALLNLRQDPSPQMRVEYLVRILAGSPLAYRTASELASELGRLGLHHQAQRFAEYALDAARNQANASGDMFELTLSQANAALDAEDWSTAAGPLARLHTIVPASFDVSCLLAESYAKAKQDTEFARIVGELESSLLSRQNEARDSLELSMELAWFYLTLKGEAETALKHAARAVELDPCSPVAQRMLGVADLKTGHGEDGEKLLLPLVMTDAYAARYLAEYYSSRGDQIKAKGMLRQVGPNTPRTGPAFRSLREYASTQDVRYLPLPGADQSDQAILRIPDDRLRIAHAPEGYVSVTMRPTQPFYRVGEPIEVDITLQNVSQVDVPLGKNGVFSPLVGFRVVASGRPAERAFMDLPLTAWPAPRYLGPGQELTTRARLDAAGLERFLNSMPLEPFDVKVYAYLDPLRRQDQMYPGLANVKILPGILRRAGMLPAPNPSAPVDGATRYRTVIGRLLYDIRKGDLATRMRAARQVGAVVSFACQAEIGKAIPPPDLRGKVDKGLPVALMVEVLKDPSPVVRSEMLVALEDGLIDGDVVRWFSSAIEDRSALVRFRLVELLGTCGLAGQEPVLKYLAKDTDKHVAAMAKVFAPEE